MADKIDAAATPTKPAPPRFVGERARTKTIKLEWPIEYDGTVYETVTLRRMTMTEVSEFMRSIELIAWYQEASAMTGMTVSIPDA